MPLLFSYGTLQLEPVQRATFGRRLAGWKDELVGFEQSLVDIEDASVVATSGRAQRSTPSCASRGSAALASGKRAWVYVDAR